MFELLTSSDKGWEDAAQVAVANASSPQHPFDLYQECGSDRGERQDRQGSDHRQDILRPLGTDDLLARLG